MATRTWRDQIGRAIHDALVEAERRGLEGKDRQLFVRQETGAFRESAGFWGLKIWREEFRHQVKGVPRPVRDARRPRPSPGQGTLFDPSEGEGPRWP